MKKFVQSHRFSEILSYGILLLVILAAYSNIYRNTFLLDDEFLLQKNILIRSWSTFFDIFRFSTTGGSGGVDSFYRPLQTVLYLIFNSIFGYSTETFHALNVALHFFNAVMICLLGQRLGFSRPGLILVALLWAVHPIHTEAVTYMSATADPLHTLMCLSALYVMTPDFSLRKIIFSIPFFILALMSKETSVVLPALACACVYLNTQQPGKIKSYLNTWPLWLTSVFYLILRATILNFNDSFDFYKTSNVYTDNIDFRFYTFLATIPYYLKLLIWPKDLHLERTFSVYVDWQWPVVVGLIVLLAALSSIYFERKRTFKFLSFAVLWALIIHSPHSGILLPVNAFFLEHWMYFVTIGGLLAFSKLCNEFIKTSYVVIIPLCLTFSYLTFQQNKRWSNAITYYNYVLSVNPQPPARVYNNLGMAYSEENNFEMAKKNYEKAIEISDMYPQTRHNLALLNLRMGDVEAAKVNFEQAVKMNPDFYYSYQYLAQIYKSKNDLQKSDYYEQLYQVTRKKFGP